MAKAWIVREHLPDGSVSDNGYYDYDELMDDIENEWSKGTCPFEVIECTPEDVRYGLDRYQMTFSIYGREAVALAEEYCKRANSCYVRLFDGDEYIGQFEPVDDDFIDIVVFGDYHDEVIEQMCNMGFAGMWCNAHIEHVWNPCYIEEIDSSAFFRI